MQETDAYLFYINCKLYESEVAVPTGVEPVFPD